MTEAMGHRIDQHADSEYTARLLGLERWDAQHDDVRHDYPDV
jgi:hypothetical protein